MPIHRPENVPRDTSDGAGNPCGPFEALLFSDAGGLTQFGAFLEILPPGSRSSIKHWHANEDEMVFMLEGVALVHEGDTVTPLHPGECATFRAGVARAHCLENVSNAPARYLVIGTRGPADTVTYPDNDRVLSFDRRTGERSYTDLEGAPADTPYRMD